MYNWSTDLRELKKDKERYEIWKLEQSINYGLKGKRLAAKALKKYWNRLRIDPARRRFLTFLLNEKSS